MLLRRCDNIYPHERLMLHERHSSLLRGAPSTDVLRWNDKPGTRDQHFGDVL